MAKVGFIPITIIRAMDTNMSSFFLLLKLYVYQSQQMLTDKSPIYVLKTAGILY